MYVTDGLTKRIHNYDVIRRERLMLKSKTTDIYRQHQHLQFLGLFFCDKTL